MKDDSGGHKESPTQVIEVLGTYILLFWPIYWP